MKKYNEENIIPLLKSLKIDETTAEDDFTSKVMNRIKADIDFDNNIDDLDKVDNLLNILPVKEIMQPKEDFTANVMNRIKSEQKKVKYNQENIQDVLKLLKTKPIKLPNKNFTENVMEKIPFTIGIKTNYPGKILTKIAEDTFLKDIKFHQRI